MESAQWKVELHEESSEEDDQHDEDLNQLQTQWDDMAIVRAFESALNGSKSRSQPSASSKSIDHKATKSKALHQSKTKPIAELPAPANEAPNEYAATQPSQEELWQAAYTQAYAQIQAQVQAQTAQTTATSGYPAPTQPSSSYGSHAARTIYGYDAPMPPVSASSSYPYPPHHGYMAPPPAPHHHGAGHLPPPPPRQFHHSPSPPIHPSQYHSQHDCHCAHCQAPTRSRMDQEAFANVLLAWYQSGYYMGRYEALQEMKARAAASLPPQ